MSLKTFGIGALARVLASSAALGAVAVVATPAAAQLTDAQAAEAAALAEAIANAVQQALAATEGQSADAQQAAVEAAMEAVVHVCVCTPLSSTVAFGG
ncbi:hypothetical protein [Phenylobacterium sp.]|uniref:hypothetical protein n=1 Tax=Phenylobacterium sp. TaxID=1871053 RepID=UPI0035C86DBA